MDHLTDKQLLDMLTQASPDPVLAEHVSDCEACAARLQALEVPWEVLGQWAVDTPDIDLTDRILGSVRNSRVIRLQQPQALVRIAASIIIGAGVGSWLGGTTTRPVTDQHVAEAMHLDVLTLSSSTGWTAPLLQDGQE